MSRKPAALAAAIVVTLVIGWAVFFHQSDDAKIRAALARLAAAVHVTPDDAVANPIARLARIQDAFGAIFDHDVRASIPELGVDGPGRRELAQIAAGAPQQVRALSVDFRGITIKLDDAHTFAQVQATAEVRATGRDGADRHDARAVDFRFAREGGDWRITSLTVWPKDEARAP